MAAHNQQSGTNNADFENMQREAIRRVQDMQRRSNNIVREQNQNNRQPNGSQQRQSNHAQNAAPSNPPDNSTHTANQSPPQNQPQTNNVQQNPLDNISAQLSSLIGGIFNNTQATQSSPLAALLHDFKLDEEKIILGILIYILAKNGADLKLVLALAYLII